MRWMHILLGTCEDTTGGMDTVFFFFFISTFYVLLLLLLLLLLQLLMGYQFFNMNIFTAQAGQIQCSSLESYHMYRSFTRGMSKSSKVQPRKENSEKIKCLELQNPSKKYNASNFRDAQTGVVQEARGQKSNRSR